MLPELDATLVRGALLPAAMALLGDRNWYLPRWLTRVPGLTRGEHHAIAIDANS